MIRSPSFFLNVVTAVCLTAGSVLTVVNTRAADPTPAIKTLPPVEYHRSLENVKKPAIVDVRTDLEFADGHLPGAVRIGIEDDDFLEKLGRLPKDKPVYVYCGSGFRSAKSAKRAAKLGFKEIYDMEGGIKAWKDAGLPVEGK